MTKAKAITNEIVENDEIKGLIFKVIVGSLIILSIFYLYLIGSITFNILARKSLENTVRTLGNEVSDLELAYLNNVNAIDKNYALSVGFVDTHNNLFATRTVSQVAVR